MATNVYLYTGAANPNDVLLYPTVSANIGVNDALPIGATDTYNNLVRTDVIFIVIGLDDSATPAIMAGNPVDDACAIQCSEVASVTQVGLLTPVDTCAIQANDSATPLVVVTISTTDTCAFQGDGIVSIFAATVASDSCAILASDVINITTPVAIAAQDAITIGETEGAPALFMTLPVVDSLAIGLNEGSASILAVTSCNDTCAIQASDATPNIIQLSILATTDACTIGESESVPLVTVTNSVVDSLALPISDTINTATPVPVSAQDALAVQEIEAQTSSLATVASDASMVGIFDDQPLIALASSATDSLALQASDVGSQQVVGSSTPISASDSCALPIIDEIEPLRAFSVIDNSALPIDERIAALAVPAEQVALMLLEEVRMEVTWHETLWGGGTRMEESRFLFAGSYRMGERNADETRGSTY